MVAELTLIDILPDAVSKKVLFHEPPPSLSLHTTLNVCALLKPTPANVGMNSDQVLPIHSPVTVSQFETVTPATTRPAMGLTGLTVDIPSSKRPLTSSDEKRPAARWSSLEFKVYYAIACIVIPIMVWIPVSLSSRESLPPLLSAGD